MGMTSALTGCAESPSRPYGVPGSPVIQKGDKYLFYFSPKRVAPRNDAVENYLAENQLIPPECQNGVTVIQIEYGEGGGAVALFACKK